MPVDGPPCALALVGFLPEVRPISCPRWEMCFAIRHQVIFAIPSLVTLQVAPKRLGQIAPHQIAGKPCGAAPVRSLPDVTQMDVIGGHRCCSLLSFL